GLQRAGNDKAAACGHWTAARQRRNPATCASADAVCPPFDAGNASCHQRHDCSVGEGAVCQPLAPPDGGGPKHRDRLPRARGAALIPCLKAGASAPEKVNSALLGAEGVWTFLLTWTSGEG